MVKTEQMSVDEDASVSSEKSVMGRGFQVLEALSRAGRPLAVPEVVRLTGLPKSTVHRLVAQFIQLGVLDRSSEGYALGMRIFEWGSHAERQRRLRTAAIPFLSDLHSRIGETVHLAVLDGHDVLYVEKIESQRAVRCPTYVGDRKLAHTTALGKAMLAFSSDEILRTALTDPLPFSTHRTVVNPGILSRQLGRVRELGFSMEVEESFLGVACVAAPVIDASGVVLGAVSIVTQTNRFDPNRLAPAILQVARRIASELDRPDQSAAV